MGVSAPMGPRGSERTLLLSLQWAHRPISGQRTVLNLNSSAAMIDRLYGPYCLVTMNDRLAFNFGKSIFY